MKVVVLYRPDSEHARITEQYVQEFKSLHPNVDVVMMNIDSPEGTAETELYGIVQYPALLALTDEGQLLNLWMGKSFPLMDEVYGAVINA